MSPTEYDADIFFEDIPGGGGGGSRSGNIAHLSLGLSLEICGIDV